MNLKNLSKTGTETIITAIKERCLKDAEGFQYHLTPKTFAKLMKNKDIHDPNGVSKAEYNVFKRQLVRAYRFWDDEEWNVKESNGGNFKLIFERDDI